ncbi:MAG: ATP-binding protein, partial [Okeania sp. SIO3B3]|nr:ATP-binding protein [Okeania sp. SIO3B3]
HMDNNAQLLTDSNVQDNLQTATEHQPVLIFFGADAGRQRAAAQFLAAHSNRALLEADLNAITGDKYTPLQATRMILRDARLTGAMAYLTGWDSTLTNHQCPPEILAELCDHPDLVIVASQANWQTDGLARRRPLEWHEFGQPTYTQRRDLWIHHLGEQYPTETTIDIAPLSDQFYLTSDQIRDSVRTAVDIQLQRGTPLTLDDLYLAARRHSSSRLNTLAQQIHPRFSWDDLILPQDQITMLGEIVNMAKGRSTVLEAWKVGKKLSSSRGISVLFSGEPGTGKTMSAEVISGALGLDMYKIDLSSIVSKYIGETEKNLERIFTEAESSNAILFFDEADALFGKRSEVSDAHDRYANIETSYLLQRMEAYNGITILATNMRGNLDEAFTRRMAFAVAFPFPDEEHRLRIWETLFPDTVPRHDDVDLSYLAKQYKLAGGNIRNIIVNSAYLAATNGGMVQMHHLMHSTMRELHKMGRGVRQPDKQFVSVKG